MQDKSTLEDTLALMRDLRARCEWDANQTHDSLRPYLIEEAHELDEAIRDHNDAQMREELGDVLLQVLFHSVVAEQRGAFDIGDVPHGLITKMQRRHPHLYDGGERQPWERMKARKRSSIEEGLPPNLPSLHRAHRLQDRAAGVGFDWPDATAVMDKIEEEVRELREALSEGVSDIIEAARVVLEQTPPELSADLVDSGIMLTGGASLLKGLDKRIREETGLRVSMAADPLASVVLGGGRLLSDFNLLRRIAIGVS